MPLFGSHLSIAGGYYRAADAAIELGMQTVQIFTKNNNQWRAKPISDDEVATFRASVERGTLSIPCSHSSYLINLASGADELWQKSVESFVVEMQRAEALGLAGVVIHPGSALELSEGAAIGRIVTALDRVLEETSDLKTEVWLETTAGQGSSIGHRFEHLGAIIEGVQEASRIGVCIDSCHIFAAGYGLQTPEEYAATMSDFDRIVGIDRVRAFHLNDSKKDRGSRVDRHEHIGEGKLGLEPFRHILNDARFSGKPMYLETPKGMRDDRNLDEMNLTTLRSLMQATSSQPPKAKPATSASKKRSK